MDDKLTLIPTNEPERQRDNFRRVEDWGKRRLEAEEQIRKEMLKYRFLLMGG